MRILVTGGAGFIGSHLVEKLLELGYGVAILDDFNDFYDPQIKRANIAAVKNHAPVFQIDLRNNNAVRDLLHREKFDAIAHLAARAGVRPSIAQPQLYYDTNVTGTLHLLDAAGSSESSASFLGRVRPSTESAKRCPFSEDLHLTQTISPYAATKIAGEFLCSTFRTSTKCTSSHCVFSPSTGRGNAPIWRSINFTRKILANEPIDQFGDGTTRRDYTYIDDIIQGVVAALKYDGAMWDIFNLGENETVQLKDLIEAIEAAVGRKAKINRLPEQPGDVPLTCADISKARRLLGYNPTTKLRDGLPKFVEWFRAQQQ
jgi:UDP-glucuronate 4-epimerase